MCIAAAAASKEVLTDRHLFIFLEQNKKSGGLAQLPPEVMWLPPAASEFGKGGLTGTELPITGTELLKLLEFPKP